MNYKAIAFDFDYTLADCTDSIIAGFHNGFTKLNKPLATEDAIKKTVGLLLEDAYTHLTGDEDKENRALFRQYFIEVAMERQRQETILLPYGEELIRKLHAKGFKLAIVSTKRADTIDFILKRLNVYDCFSIIIGSETVSSHKPDPEGLNLVLSTLKLDKSELLFCGDTILDAGAAKNLGCDFAGVLNGTTSRETLSEYPNIGICEDLKALADFLEV